MRNEGFLRIQEWLPETAIAALKGICQSHGITQREALIRSIELARAAPGLVEEK